MPLAPHRLPRKTPTRTAEPDCSTKIGAATDVDVLFHCLDSGDFVSARQAILLDRRLTMAEGIDGWNAVMFAVHHDDADAVTDLVLLGCDLNHADDRGITPLMLAATKGHAGCVEALLRFGYVDINAQAHTGMTAFTLALELGYSHIARMLWNYGASVVLGAEGKSPVELVHQVKSVHRDLLQEVQSRYRALH